MIDESASDSASAVAEVARQKAELEAEARSLARASCLLVLRNDRSVFLFSFFLRKKKKKRERERKKKKNKNKNERNKNKSKLFCCVVHNVLFVFVLVVWRYLLLFVCLASCHQRRLFVCLFDATQCTRATHRPPIARPRSPPSIANHKTRPAITRSSAVSAR